MYRLRCLGVAVVGIFLTTTGSAEEPGRPPFSWDTVPLYAHFGATGGMSDADVEFIATHYDFIALEKNHGASQYGTTEEGTIVDVARIKAINPDASVLFYWNLLLDYPIYTVSEQRDDDASWFIHDTDGNLDLKPSGRDGLRKYDLSNPDFQSWWADTAADMLVRGSMDGVFIDALPQVSARPNSNQKKWGLEKYEAIESGIGETLDVLKQKIGPDTTVIYNGIRSVPGGWEHGGLKYLQHADGVIVEHFDAFQSRAPQQIAEDMDRMAEAGRQGKVVILKAFPGFSWVDRDMMQKSEAELLELAKFEITFPLAAFLIVAQEHFYFNYTWGYRDFHGAYAWYQEYDRRLGSPKGNARQDGYEYWREFEHASVYINISSKQATIEWH